MGNPIYRRNLYLNCLNCGKPLGVRILERKNKVIVTKGKVSLTENKVTITVKCSKCRGKSVFEREKPYLGASGWKKVKGIPYKRKIPPALYEVDKTYAESYRRRRR